VDDNQQQQQQQDQQQQQQDEMMQEEQIGSMTMDNQVIDMSDWDFSEAAVM
jgi:hypothetical protein